MNTQKVHEKGFYKRFIVSVFRRAAKEVCATLEQRRKSGEIDDLFAAVQGIIHPSDGHPQEEHTPDFGWFRPLAHNNATWVLYWPELEV
jgi:hypothetical protein